MKHFSRQSGYSLVEVLVAIALLLIGIMGPMTIAAKGLRSAIYTQDQTTALFLAQEGIEVMKGVRNEQVMYDVNNNQLSNATSWWTQNNPNNTKKLVNKCLDTQSTNGCNFDVGQETPPGTVESMATRPGSNGIKCGNGNDMCRMYFNASNVRARYTSGSTNGSVATKFHRQVTLHLLADGGVKVTSVVWWDSNFFVQSGTAPQVVLTTVLYPLYQ